MNDIHDCKTQLGHGQLHSQNAPPKRTRTCALTDTAGNTSTTTSTVPAGNTSTVDVGTKGKGFFEGNGLDKSKGSKIKGSDRGKSKGSTRKGSDGCKSKGALGRGKGNTCEEEDDDEPIVFRYHELPGTTAAAVVAELVYSVRIGKLRDSTVASLPPSAGQVSV